MTATDTFETSERLAGRRFPPLDDRAVEQALVGVIADLGELVLLAKVLNRSDEGRTYVRLLIETAESALSCGRCPPPDSEPIPEPNCDCPWCQALRGHVACTR